MATARFNLAGLNARLANFDMPNMKVYIVDSATGNLIGTSNGEPTTVGGVAVGPTQLANPIIALSAAQLASANYPSSATVSTAIGSIYCSVSQYTSEGLDWRIVVASVDATLSVQKQAPPILARINGLFQAQEDIADKAARDIVAAGHVGMASVDSATMTNAEAALRAALWGQNAAIQQGIWAAFDNGAYFGYQDKMPSVWGGSAAADYVASFKKPDALDTSCPAIPADVCTDVWGSADNAKCLPADSGCRQYFFTDAAGEPGQPIRNRAPFDMLSHPIYTAGMVPDSNGNPVPNWASLHIASSGAAMSLYSSPFSTLDGMVLTVIDPALFETAMAEYNSPTTRAYLLDAGSGGLLVAASNGESIADMTNEGQQIMATNAKDALISMSAHVLGAANYAPGAYTTGAAETVIAYPIARPGCSWLLVMVDDPSMADAGALTLDDIVGAVENVTLATTVDVYTTTQQVVEGSSNATTSFTALLQASGNAVSVVNLVFILLIFIVVGVQGKLLVDTKNSVREVASQIVGTGHDENGVEAMNPLGGNGAVEMGHSAMQAV